MLWLLCAGQLPFEDHPIPIFGGSDHRLYARLRDLCTASGVNFARQLHALEEHRLLAKHLVILGRSQLFPGAKGVEPTTSDVYLNLGALSVWLGTLDPRQVQDPAQRERLINFRHQFQELFWILIRQGFVVSAPGQSS